jgi:NitT/TauT family transport system substrate-binding protein
MRIAAAIVFTLLCTRSIPAQGLAPVHVVAGVTEASVDVYYALDMGFFQRAGLDVDFEQVRSGQVEAAAVAAGRADIADSNVISLAQAISRNVPFVAIAPEQEYDTRVPAVEFVVLPNSPAHVAKDINNTTVSVSSLGSIAELCVDAWVDKNGGDLSTIKIVEVTFAQTVAALEAGRVSAGVLSEPQLSDQRSRIRTLGKCFDAIAPHFTISVYFTSSDWANKHPLLVRKFADAINAADDWANKNPAQAAAIVEKWEHVTISKGKYVHAKTLDPAMLQPLLDGGAKYKLYPRPVSAAEMMWKSP